MLSTKYIPDSYDDLIVNENIITILQSNLNVILYGPSGSGKTTMIKTLLKHKGNDKYLVINVADNRGINLIRDNIIDFINIDTISIAHENVQKVVILDEMDSLTYDAQNILNSIMESCCNKSIRFIFVCNYFNNISQSIVSKCCCLRINCTDNSKLINRIKYICNNENINIDINIIEFIIKHFNNDIRKIINLLDIIKMIHEDDVITIDDIKCLINV